jgi:hypothetical protein
MFGGMQQAAQAPLGRKGGNAEAPQQKEGEERGARPQRRAFRFPKREAAERG